MKILNIFLILSMILFMGAWAERIQVTETCYSRVSDSSLQSAGIVKAGTEFEVLEKTGAWHFVKFIDGTKHVGKKGWVWRKLIEDNVIKGKGCNVHEKAATDSETLFSVKGGAKIELIKKDVKWYKVGDQKYIYYANVKVIE